MALTASRRQSHGGLLGTNPGDTRLYEQYLQARPQSVQPSAQDVFSNHYDQLINSNRDRDPNVLMTGIKALHSQGNPNRLPTIDEVETAGREYLKANEPGYVETIGKGIVRGFQGMAQGVNEIARWGIESGLPLAGALPMGKLVSEEKRTKWAQPFKEGAEYWRRAATEGIAAPDPQIFGGTFFQNPSFKRAVGIIAEAVPSLGAAIVTGGATGSTFAGALMLGALEGAPQYGEARAKGKSIDEASLYGALSVAGTTLLEYLPISRMFKRSGGFFRGAAQGMLEEGVQESTQQLWQNIIAKIGYEPTQDLAEGIIESFIGGAGAGGMAGGTVAKLNQAAETARRGGVTNEEYNALWTDVANQVQSIPHEQFKEIIEVTRQRASSDFGNEALQKAAVALEQENRRRFDREYEQIIDDVAGFDKPLRPLRSGATLLEDVDEARKSIGQEPEVAPAEVPFEGRWTAGEGKRIGAFKAPTRSGGQVLEETGPTPIPEKGSISKQEDVDFIGRWVGGYEALKSQRASEAEKATILKDRMSKLSTQPDTWINPIMKKYQMGEQGVLRAVSKGLAGQRLGRIQQDVFNEFQSIAKEKQKSIDSPQIEKEQVKSDLKSMRDSAVQEVVSTLESSGENKDLLSLAKDEKAFRETMGEKKTPQYSSRGQEQQIQLKDLQETFKGQQVGTKPDGSFYVQTKSGHGLEVKNVNQISPDKFAFEVAYGRQLKGEMVAGQYQSGKIEISKVGDKWTLQHETSHWLEDTGILTPMEVSVIRGHIRKLTRQGKFTPENENAPGGAEDRASFIADQLNKAPQGTVGKIIGKVREWIDRFVNLFQRTPQGIVRDIESGKVYERTGKEASGLPFFQSVFHGSPYRFDKFTTDRMGTGEGAQAFGWGLYFAGKKEVADFYRSKLESEEDVIDTASGRFTKTNNGWFLEGEEQADTPMALMLDSFFASSSTKEAKAVLEEELENLADYGENYDDERNDIRTAIQLLEDENPTHGISGQLYEVDIPENDELLDWDKPVTEQNERVIEKLKGADVEQLPYLWKLRDRFQIEKRRDRDYALYGPANWSPGGFTQFYGSFKSKKLARAEIGKQLEYLIPTGEMLYDILKRQKGGPQAASEYLNSLGIKGHRFLDQGSRSKGEGTYNYVIYDDDAIKILKTYYSAQQPQYSVRLKDMQAAMEPFIERVKKNKVIDTSQYYKKTGIQLPTNNPQDLNKWFRRIQTMQDMARNYPNMKRLFDTEVKRVSDANQQSVADKEKTDPYFKLPATSREKVNFYLLQGDQETKTYKDQDLRDNGLTTEEIQGYKSIRKILDEKLDVLVGQMITHALDEGQTLSPEMIKAIRRGRDIDKMNASLKKAGIKADQRKRLSWIANWVAEREGYVPHKWDSEWVVRIDLGKGEQWLLEVPTVLGKTRPTRLGRQESANEAAIREVKKKLGLSDSKIQALADEGKVKLIRTRELPVELFQGARMDVISSIIQAATDNLHAQYVKDLPAEQQNEFKDIRAKLKKTVEELYLAKGWGRHLIGRKGVKGYREDLENVLAEYLYGFNAFVAKGEAARNFAQVMKDINPTQEPEQWRHGKEFISDMLGESSEAGWFKKYAGLYFLAGDLSAAVLNMTQNWTHAVPLLRGIKGNVSAERQIASAMKDIAGEYASARKNKRKVFTQANKYISQEEIDALRKAYERGLLDPVFLGETTGFHPNKIWQSYTQKFWDVIFKLFTGAEGWNRTSTFLAAYRRSKDIDKAIEVVQGAHFQYGRGNRPDIVRKTGAVGNIAYTYMTYPMNNLVFLKHRAQDVLEAVHQGDKEAVRTGLKVLGSHMAYAFAFGGMMGLPFAWLGEWIWKLFSEPEDDWELWMNKHLPKPVAQTVSRGIPAALLGNDMSWRIQGTDVLGIPVGFQVVGTAKRRAEQAARMWGQGEHFDAIFHLTPDMVRNIYRAVIGFEEGGTRRGVPPIKYTTGEAITRGLGFSPTRESEAYKSAQLVKEKKAERNKKLQDFAERLMVARQRGNTQDIKELMQDVTEYNRKERKKGAAGVPIPWKTVSSSAKKRLKSKQTPYGENIPDYMRGYQREVRIGG